VHQRVLYRWLTFFSVLVLAFPLIAAAFRIVKDPEVSFLVAEGGAEWIQLNRPFSLRSWKGDEGARLRKRFYVEKPSSRAVVNIKALRTAQLYLDGVLVLPFNYIEDWKTSRSVDLKPLLTPGWHELYAIALNENGPAALLVWSEALQVDTDKSWEASLDGSKWGPVKYAGEREPGEMSRKFPSSVTAFFSLSAYLIPAFFLCFFLFLFRGRLFRRQSDLIARAISPPVVRWAILAGWGILAMNNIMKIPLVIGFDAPDHYDYISYILNKGSVPLATDGWQMFQSPLYYLISALLQLPLSSFFPTDKIQMLLRIIPLVCGAAQVELAYRTAVLVFPLRKDLQIFGIVIGGLLPMNLYISQVVGNEPLAGLLSSAAIVVTLGILKDTDGAVSIRRAALLGLLLGLALLTKFTAILLIPPVLLALIFVMGRRGESLQSIMKKLLVLFGIILAVSGWYYFRNWIELGKPFVGGWDLSRKILWWQDPGFRMLSDFSSFGNSLLHPMYSAIYGFWDSLYSTFWLDGFAGSVAYEFRPRWNYSLMLSGALLSLVPAVGIVAGFFRTAFVRAPADYVRIFSVYCVSVYLAALIYIYITVPIYSTAKATYTVGLIPCYVILCVTGFEFLTKNKFMDAAIKALMVCWGFTSYFSYFVL